MRIHRPFLVVATGLAVSGAVAIAASTGGASSAGAPPSLGASYRPSTNLGTKAECLRKGEAALRSAGFRIERFTSFVRGTGSDVAALIHCIAADKTVQLNVIVAGNPGFAAKANDTRICLTDYILGKRSSCGAGQTPSQPPASTGGSGWTATAKDLRGRNNQRFRFTCEANGSLGRIWGTGVYTDDSSVCTAGVHAGLITRASGGTVVIEIRPGQSSYTGSTRNGVTSGNWSGWYGSFVFVR
jgi:hypothetical protein